MASDYLNSALAQHVFGKATYTAPANIFVGLSTADPLDDGTGLAEPSGGDYARVSTAPANWDESAGVVTNNAAVTFAVPTGNWGEVTYVVLFDAASGGNILDSTPLPSSQTVDVGSTAPQFNAGTLFFTVT